MEQKLCICGCGYSLDKYDNKRRERSYIKGHNKPWLGRKRSEETKRKISLGLTGKKQRVETIEKRRLAMTGKVFGPQPYRQGKNSVHWKNKDKFSVYGYILDYVGTANGRTVYVFRHRRIMEESIGRKLSRTEIVHHINGNKLDNRIENLILLKNQSEHKKLHKEIGVATRFKKHG